MSAVAIFADWTDCHGQVTSYEAQVGRAMHSHLSAKCAYGWGTRRVATV